MQTTDVSSLEINVVCLESWQNPLEELHDELVDNLRRELYM